MSYNVEIGETGARGRVSWKVLRHEHGSKLPREFERRRQAMQFLRKRPWITQARLVDEHGKRIVLKCES